MTWRLMDAVCGLADLPDEEFRVLMLLAKRAHDDGTHAFPSVERLARECGKARRTIQRILRSLERRGLITAAAHRHGGRGHATEYHLHLHPKGATGDTLPRRNGDAHDALSGNQRASAVTVKGVAGDHERASPVTAKGDAGDAPIYPVIDHPEHIQEPEGRATAVVSPTPAVVCGEKNEALAAFVAAVRALGETVPPRYSTAQMRAFNELVRSLRVEDLARVYVDLKQNGTDYERDHLSFTLMLKDDFAWNRVQQRGQAPRRNRRGGFGQPISDQSYTGADIAAQAAAMRARGSRAWEGG
jgi:hypothetical protein